MVEYFWYKHKQLTIAGFIFIFFYIIFSLSPISGDDWGNYLICLRGPRGWVGNAIGMYFDWEGRFISRLFINMFTCHKWAWNLFNALAMASLYYFSIKLIKPKKIFLSSVILLLGILLIGHSIFNQTYLWLAGNLTYFLPLVLIVIYFYLINKYLSNNNIKWYMYMLFIIFNIIIPMFVENMGAVLILTNIAVLIYILWKKKTINKLFIINLLIASISFLIMLLSPGTALRMAHGTSWFQALPLIDKGIYNIPNFINFTFINNYFILFIMPISFLYMVHKKIEHISLRLVLNTIGIIPLIVIISCIAGVPSLSFFYQTNIIMIIFWFIYLIIFLSLLIKIFKDHLIIIFYFLIGLMSNIAMLLSPVWGPRTSLFTVYMLILTSVFILDKVNIKQSVIKIINRIAFITLMIVALIYMTLYYNIYLQNQRRILDIKTQLKENKQTIEIEHMPDYALCNINPINDYHVKTFKKYYNISDDKEIIIKPFEYKDYLFYNK